MPLHILVISDNEPLAAYLGDLARDSGHRATLVPTPQEIFRAVRRHTPDLIILAVEAHLLPSLAVEHRVHSPEGPRPVPVIVISEALRLEAELLHVFDFIPKPLESGRLLEDLAAVSDRRSRRPPEEGLDPLLAAEFAAHILSCTGLHFELRNQAALERGIGKRMVALRMGSYREYFDYLGRHGEDRHELQKLLQFLTVGETYFFRYPAHFEALTERLRSLPAAHPVRIWSAGCSTGEEPYSIAMAIMEAFPDWRRRDLQVIATDINNRSLKQARDGVYSPWSMRSTPVAVRERHFDRVGESFLIKDEVKELVRFAHLNLTAPCNQRVCDELQRLDAIFCRNVLIYFSAETAETVLQGFSDRLRPRGLLFLGHAETLLQRPLDLQIRRRENSFYYERGEASAAAAPQEATPGKASCCAPTAEQPPRPVWISAPGKLPCPSPGPLPPCMHAGPPPTEIRIEGARRLFEREEFDAALGVVDGLLAEYADQVDALVLKGFIQAGKGDLEQAHRTCDRVMRLNDLLPAAYFLRGVLLDAEDRLEEAAQEYRKALLLDHDFIMPRYHMGRLHQRLGRVAEAAREIRNSIRILSRQDEGGTVPFSGGLTRPVCMVQLQNALAQVA